MDVGLVQDEHRPADVKSCGPDTPTLVSGATRKRCRLRWPESPVHRGDHDISVKNVARGMPVVRLNLWYLPPAFFFAGGPWVRPASGIPRALSLFEWVQRSQSSGVIRRENERSWVQSC